MAVPVSALTLAHGTVVGYAAGRDGAPRRVRETDRRGNDLVALTWRDDGALARADVRVDEGWLAIEPAATREAPWGLSDRLWRVAHPEAPLERGAGEALTLFQALDYAAIALIPTLLEPARVPPGGGAAILNLVAALAQDQGRARLRYAGPYPGEQLFLTLLESFRYDGALADPLAAFAAGTLAWTPAPHERVLTAEGAWVQVRDRVEKVTYRGRRYYRRDWQGLRRRASHVVRDDGARVLCSLVALGDIVEDHLAVTHDGERVEVLPRPVTPAIAPVPLAPAAWRAIAAIVALRSAAPLGPFIDAAAAEAAAEVGPVPGDLVAFRGDRVRVSPGVLALARRRLAAAGGREEALATGLMVLAEIAGLVDDELRRRAHARIARLPGDAQARIAERSERASQEEDERPRVIAEGVEALLASVCGVEDQQCVEPDEGSDRDDG